MNSGLSIKGKVVFNTSVFLSEDKKLKQLIEQASKHFKAGEYIIFDYYDELYRLRLTDTYVYTFNDFKTIANILIGNRTLDELEVKIFDNGNIIFTYVANYVGNIKIKYLFSLFNIDSLQKKDIIKIFVKYGKVLLKDNPTKKKIDLNNLENIDVNILKKILRDTSKTL